MFHRARTLKKKILQEIWERVSGNIEEEKVEELFLIDSCEDTHNHNRPDFRGRGGGKGGKTMYSSKPIIIKTKITLRIQIRTSEAYGRNAVIQKTDGE